MERFGAQSIQRCPHGETTARHSTMTGRSIHYPRVLIRALQVLVVVYRWVHMTKFVRKHWLCSSNNYVDSGFIQLGTRRCEGTFALISFIWSQDEGHTIGCNQFEFYDRANGTWRRRLLWKRSCKVLHSLLEVIWLVNGCEEDTMWNCNSSLDSAILVMIPASRLLVIIAKWGAIVHYPQCSKFTLQSVVVLVLVISIGTHT